ncbi:MAG TPA: hypothetical protein VGB74_06245 [Actinoplanes sp.]
MAQRMKPADNGHTLERLLERAESQDRIDENRPPAARTTSNQVLGSASPRTVTPASFGTATRSPAETAPPSRPVADNGFGADDGRSAALGDTGAAFAELMAGLDASGHTEIERPSPRPKAPREDVPTVRPFRPAAAESPAPPKPPAAAPPKPTVAAHPSPSLAERIGGLSPSTVEVDPVPPVQSAAETYGLNPDQVSPTSAVPSRAPAKPVQPVQPVAQAQSAEPDPVVRNLISVGMPEEMANQITGGDTYAGVLSVLAARPSAPGIPDGPGEILVLAGDLNLSVPIARQLLDQIEVPENHLLLAAPTTAGTGLHSSRLISTPEAAEGRVEKLHSAEDAWIVVLDAPVGGTDPLWVNEMCDALGATALWAIVDATRKTADTARHLRTLGEVEALVVHGVELTADPASVLGLDLPIFSLDGKPATPHAWAAMLCARIASDVMPVAAVPRRVTRSARQ